MSTTVKIPLQALLIAILGLGLGLAWNLVNPRGIALIPRVSSGSGNPGAAYEDMFDVTKSMPLKDKISLQEAHGLWMDGRVFFVDARSEREFRALHIPGAFNIHDQSFPKHFPEYQEILRQPILPEDREKFPCGYPILVYCNNRFCDEAKTVLLLLKDLGFESARCLASGLDSWVNAGRENEKFEVAMTVDHKEVMRKGKDIPTLSSTGIAWLPPGGLLAAFLLLPWILLIGGVRLGRKRNRFFSGIPPALGLVFRLGLGAVFLYACYFKLADPGGFQQMVACYELLPAQAVPVFTVCLPAVEALAGALLVLGLGTRPASLVLLGTLWVFIAAIYTLLTRNMNCVCGCFPGEYTVSWVRIAEDTAFIFAGLAAFVWGGRWLALEGLFSRRSRNHQPPA